MSSCYFATYEFPTEIPRTQNRNYPYTTRCVQYKKHPELNGHICFLQSNFDSSITIDNWNNLLELLDF